MEFLLTDSLISTRDTRRLENILPGKLMGNVQPIDEYACKVVEIGIRLNRDKPNEIVLINEFTASIVRPNYRSVTRPINKY